MRDQTQQQPKVAVAWISLGQGNRSTQHLRPPEPPQLLAASAAWILRGSRVDHCGSSTHITSGLSPIRNPAVLLRLRRYVPVVIPNSVSSRASVFFWASVPRNPCCSSNARTERGSPDSLGDQGSPPMAPRSIAAARTVRSFRDAIFSSGGFQGTAAATMSPLVSSYGTFSNHYADRRGA
jgi:hypothetical protein